MVNITYLDEWPDLGVVVKDKVFADHCPIFLKAGSLDYGPPPFRFYDHCLTEAGFTETIKETWARGLATGSADVVLKEKLKGSKHVLKSGDIQAQTGWEDHWMPPKIYS